MADFWTLVGANMLAIGLAVFCLVVLDNLTGGDR